MTTDRTIRASGTSSELGALRPKEQPHIPGETGVWLVVLVDMTVFAILFLVFLYYRSADPQLFFHSQQSLDRQIGVMNTFLLLTSSLFVVKGVHASRESQAPITPRWFTGALICGCAFILNKFFEYGEKIKAGITPLTNDFYMYYYVLTGLHLLHVVIGVCLILFLRAKTFSGYKSKGDIMLLEGGATYWHMVDLLWVVLFPLIYLVS